MMRFSPLFVLCLLLPQDHVNCDTQLTQVVGSRARRWAAGFDDVFPQGVWSAKQRAMAKMIGVILEVTDEEEGPLLRLLLGLWRSVLTKY